MFNPNEEIQVIGFTLDDNVTWEDKFKVNEILTKLNKKLELIIMVLMIVMMKHILLMMN